MVKKKKTNIDSARESLEDILRRIKPYMPKKPQGKPEEPKEWHPVDSHTFPPMSSSEHAPLI